MTTPMIDALLAHCDKYPSNAWYFTEPGIKARDVAAELRDLLAERDALKAKLDAQTPPPRRLREYKGVTYREGKWHALGHTFASAVSVCSIIDYATDADHAALLALRDDPYEPVETVEQIIEAALNRCCNAVNSYAIEGPWEGTIALASKTAEKIRAHLSQQTPTLTADECVARLVELGAYTATLKSGATIRTDLRVVVMPPEVSP